MTKLLNKQTKFDLLDTNKAVKYKDKIPIKLVDS